MEDFDKIGSSLKTLNDEAKSLSAKDSEENLTDIIEQLRKEEVSLTSSVADLKRDAEEYEERRKSDINSDIVSLKSERSHIGESVKKSNSELRAIHVEMALKNEELKKLEEEITKQDMLTANNDLELNRKLKEHELRVEADYAELQDRAREIDEKINNHNLRANELDRKESDFKRKEVEFNENFNIKDRQLIEKNNALDVGIKSLEKNRAFFEKDRDTIMKDFVNKGIEFRFRENAIIEKEELIQTERDGMEAKKSEILKSIEDLKTNWKVFKQEKTELKLKLKKLGG